MEKQALSGKWRSMKYVPRENRKLDKTFQGLCVFHLKRKRNVYNASHLQQASKYTYLLHDCSV